MSSLQERLELEDPISELLGMYTELNNSNITELQHPPSALEFMRFVAKNRPFVLRRGAREWKAKQLWNKDFLIQAMKDEVVNVAVTPFGSDFSEAVAKTFVCLTFRSNADSPVLENGNMLFVKPLEESQSFEEFINYVTSQQLANSPGEVRYAQTREIYPESRNAPS